MKKQILGMIGMLAALVCGAAEQPQISDLTVESAINGDNITFTLKLSVDDFPKGGVLPLVEGEVALLKADVPGALEMRREGSSLVLAEADSAGWFRSRRGDVVVQLAVRAAPTTSGEWRRAVISMPVLPIRPVVVTGDRTDLEIHIDGARDLKRETIKNGCKLSGFMLQTPELGISWKTEIRRLDAELMTSCDATTVASIGAGALRIRTLYTYQIMQGVLNELVFDVPDVTITQVSGEDIQDWRVDRTDPKAPRLHVSLGRPQRESYKLVVESERALPAFPCSLALPVIAPRNTIRSGGTLLLGTDSAIKIQPSGLSGLTQTDPNSFPANTRMALPQRSVFTYQYASMPYAVQVALEDIVMAVNADIGITANIGEGELTIESTVQLEVHDAPAREIRLFTDADAKWTIAAVNGTQVAESDVDIRNVEGGREIVVPFRQPVSDTAVLHVRMEQPSTAARTSVTVPRLSVPAARTQRGYVIAAAVKGLRLVANTNTLVELREVHTASLPVRVDGAQLAYRFRETPWKLEIGIERAKSAIHSEVFHLVSLGEGVMYVSAAITCHISGAPVQNLRFSVPASIGVVDVVGAGIDNWARSNDVCTVQLANRTMGDYTLLITYDCPLNYRGADMRVGDIAVLGSDDKVDSEMGYIAIATSSPLKLTEPELPATLIRIGRDELPPGYAATITAPVIGAYKYVRQPHAATLRITPLNTERAIDQVVDFLSLATTIGRDGESVTHATYSVKNASRQYLTVQLPKGAALWSVRQLLKPVAVPMEAQMAQAATMPVRPSRELASQQSKVNGSDVLLVPVDRPRDPNQAVTIEIGYTQPGQRGWHRVRLEAPALSETPVTYASWEVTANGNHAISYWGGNMTPEPAHVSNNFMSFYRTANLVGDKPLCVNMLLVPAWLAAGSVRVLVVAALLGLLLLVVAVKRRCTIWWALALTALGLAAAQIWHDAVITGFVLLVIVALLIQLVRRVICWAKRPRPEAEVKQDDSDASTFDEPPLSPESSQMPHTEASKSPSSPSNNNDRSGGVGIRLLAMMTLVSGLALAAPRSYPSNMQLPVDTLDLNIQAPTLDPRAEHSASVSWKMKFTAKQAGRYQLLGMDSVLVHASGASSGLRLETSQTGCMLNVLKAGSYEIAFESRERVVDCEGRWTLSLMAPPSLMNHFALTVPAADMEIASAQIVSLSVTNRTGETRAEGVLDTSRALAFTWRPRPRVTSLEQAVVYCDVDSVAFVRAGVVDLSARANYKVVQGEIRELRLRIPAGVSVTSVGAPALATWSLDPATHILVALLSRPVSDAFTLTLGLQMPSGGLPYNTVVRVPSVENVQRQRGQLAFAATEAMLLRFGEMKPGEIEGVSPVNISDFSATEIAVSGSEPLRRAFRYDDPAAVRVALCVEPVQPEIRVSESGSFSIGDERDVLSTTLELAIAKAGIFSVKLQIPEGYDIETLTGRDVSHWDDTRRTGQSGDTNAVRQVEVFFKKRVQDSTRINLVLAQPQRGVADKITLPRVSVVDAARHTGAMSVAAERGVRLALDEQQGVSVHKPEIGEKVQPTAVSFEILRPAWLVSLRTQVMAPVLKPEALHCVDLAEGMLQHRVYLRYRIENAGVKTFRVRVPVKEATLSVSGRNIARVMPVENDPEAGSGRVWLVELHGKVEDSFAITCFYQQPYDPASGGVTINAFDTLGVARQSGWLVVTGGGRVQVEPRGSSDGLKAEDARSLPDTFGAGDLSSAIRCYRVLQPDYHCDLSVVRHSAAAVLPATVEKTHFVTVVSSSGKMLTQATMDLKVGDLRFLKVQMPKDGIFWSALVNGAEVTVSRDGACINVPLENLTADRTTAVTLIYADSLGSGGFSGRSELHAPSFPDVPLRNVNWTFFIPPEFRYAIVESDFDQLSGTGRSRHFGKAEYEDYNKRIQSDNISVAKNSMKDIGQLLESGHQQEAQQVLQQAVNLSQSDQSLNEDARIQFKNVVKQQVKMGLVNRREQLRVRNNIYDEIAPNMSAGFNDGNFNSAYVSQVEEQLSAQDRSALDKVAARIVEQQGAAAGQGTAINIAMPQNGREVQFERALQCEKGGALKVIFRFGKPSLLSHVLAYWPAVPLFLVLWGALALIFRRRCCWHE